MTSIDIEKVYVGEDSISKMYLGDDLLWPYTSPISGNYMAFEIISGGTINWTAEDSTTTARTISYSINGNPWTDITSSTGGTSFNVNSGDMILFKGENNTYGGNTFGGSTAYFNLSGNIMSLLYGDDFEGKESLPSWGGNFPMLFCGTKAVNAQYLELPAITLKDSCYQKMFLNCTELISAPALPATTLTDYCYFEMFEGCISLISAPELPAQTLSNGCYNMMFSGCTNLNYIKCLAVADPTSSLELLGPLYWVSDVSANGTFIKAAGANWEMGDSGIPNNWTIINE